MVFGFFEKKLNGSAKPSKNIAAAPPVAPPEEPPKSYGPPVIETPITVEIRSQQADLMATGEALSDMWEEKGERFRTLWAIHNTDSSHIIALNPHTAWDFMRSTASLGAKTEKWRQKMEKALKDSVEMMQKVCDQTNRLYYEGKDEIARLKDENFNKIETLAKLNNEAKDQLEAKIAALEKNPQAAVEAQKEECKRQLEAKDAECAGKLKDLELANQALKSALEEKNTVKGNIVVESLDEISKNHATEIQRYVDEDERKSQEIAALKEKLRSESDMHEVAMASLRMARTKDMKDMAERHSEELAAIGKNIHFYSQAPPPTEHTVIEEDKPLVKKAKKKTKKRRKA